MGVVSPHAPTEPVPAWHRWKEWVNIFLGIWLFLTAWFWGSIGSAHSYVTYAGYRAGAWNAWIVGAFIFVVALCVERWPKIAWMEWLNVLAAIWLFASPWVLGSQAVVYSAAIMAWAVAIAVFVMSLWSALERRLSSTRTAGVPPAG